MLWLRECIPTNRLVTNMIQFNRTRSIGLAGLLSLYLTAAMPAQSPDTGNARPDNTRANKQTEGSATADDQNNNPSDRELTRKIRQAVIADKSLSTYAHNIKIIAQGGTVTLKGPVRTEDERTTVAAKAKEIAGAGKVVNQLTVAGKNGNDSH